MTAVGTVQTSAVASAAAHQGDSTIASSCQSLWRDSAGRPHEWHPGSLSQSGQDEKYMSLSSNNTYINDRELDYCPQCEDLTLVK